MHSQVVASSGLSWEKLRSKYKTATIKNQSFCTIVTIALGHDIKGNAVYGDPRIFLVVHGVIKVEGFV